LRRSVDGRHAAPARGDRGPPRAGVAAEGEPVSTLALPPAASARALPHLGWWLLLGAILAAGILVGWTVATALLLVALAQRVWPLHFQLAYVGVVAGATFVDYTRGFLTPQLSLLSLGILFMLFCYLLPGPRPPLTLPRSLLTVPLVAYLALSLFNFARGVVAGNSLRYAGLEILSVLALASGLLVANRLRVDKELKPLVAGLWAIALGHVVLGFYVFSTVHMRTGRLSFTPVPGVVVMLLLNLALRSRRPVVAAGWLAASLPLWLHQFMSFTRGYWLALIGGTLFSLVAFARRGAGVGARWRWAGALLAGLVGMALVGAVALGGLFEIRDLAEQASARFTSSLSTKSTYAAGSNIVRLAEYVTAIGHVREAPWLGHGFGYFIVRRDPFDLKLVEEWAVHQNYLLVWLKQGLVGLALFVWMLHRAVRMGLAGAMRSDSWEAAWCAGTAAATVYVALYAFVHFPLAEINTPFPLALLWGGAMAITARGHDSLVWRAGRGGRA
jgi:O-antigen ligase